MGVIYRCGVARKGAVARPQKEKGAEAPFPSSGEVREDQTPNDFMLSVAAETRLFSGAATSLAADMKISFILVA